MAWGYRGGPRKDWKMRGSRKSLHGAKMGGGSGARLPRFGCACVSCCGTTQAWHFRCALQNHQMGKKTGSGSGEIVHLIVGPAPFSA